MVFLTHVRFLASKGRTPLIKFRGSPGSQQNQPQQQSKQTTPATVKTAAVSHTSELPTKFMRRLIDQEEIEYINRGGPA